MNRRKYIFILLLCLTGNAACYVTVQQNLQSQQSNESKPNIAKPNISVAPAKSELPKDLIEKFIVDMNDNENDFRLSESDLEILHKHLNFRLHDLNADGINEYFLFIEHSDWCGAGSNCSYWIYQKTDDGFNLLVEDKVLRVKETVTNGYQDLSSETPMGFCESKVQRVAATPYKYDGKQYKAVGEPKDECRPF